MDQIPPFLQQGSSEDSRDEGNEQLLHVWVGKQRGFQQIGFCLISQMFSSALIPSFLQSFISPMVNL